MTEQINRIIFTKGLVAIAGGLAIDRLSGSALAAGNADPIHKAETELKDAKQHLERAAVRTVKHAGRKFARIADLVGEPKVELDHGTLFLTGPDEEQLPDMWFAYYDENNWFSVSESSRHPEKSGLPNSFYGRFYLPDNGNVIHDKIAAGQPEAVTAEDVRDLVKTASYKPSQLTVSTHRSDEVHSVFFQPHNHPPLYSTDNDIRQATATELHDVASTIRRVDRSQSLSVDAHQTV